jgi:hypothetical protein
MKALVCVSSIVDVPLKYRQSILVITKDSWEDCIELILGKNTDQYLYIQEGVSMDSFLKLVEDYQGNMVVYTSLAVSSVMLSRFTVCVNRRSVQLKEIKIGSFLEKELLDIKADMGS